LATRLSETAGPTIDDQVKLGFQIVFARTPTAVELAKSLEFLDEQQRSYVSTGNPADKARATALADLCHMLLSSNEFLYVE
jgi:hypothetical protein